MKYAIKFFIIGCQIANIVPLNVIKKELLKKIKFGKRPLKKLVRENLVMRYLKLLIKKRNTAQKNVEY